ncbi:hypothetical protein NHQ30_002911 [Ciborinia camelliae]|nr:hypothetical protein NHQ30_002911 [Ciborinia camelliae]
MEIPRTLSEDMPKSSAVIDADCTSFNANSSADTMIQQTTNTFEPFPRLPLELRQKIWCLACSQERLFMPIMSLREKDRPIGTSPPEPSVMLVNHESCIEAEKVYKKVRLDADGQKFRTFFVNPNKDILIFDGVKEYYHDSKSEWCSFTYFCLYKFLVRGPIMSSISPLLYYVGIIKMLDFQFDDDVWIWFHIDNEQYTLFELMPNFKRLILVPAAQDSHCDSLEEQNACIQHIGSLFRQKRETNKDYPMPVIEFELPAESSTSKLEAPTLP